MKGPAPDTPATHDSAAVDILTYATGECALGQVLIARSNRQLMRKEAMA